MRKGSLTALFAAATLVACPFFSAFGGQDVSVSKEWATRCGFSAMSKGMEIYARVFVTYPGVPENPYSMGHVDGKKECKVLLVRKVGDQRSVLVMENAPNGVVIVGGTFEGVTPSGEAVVNVSDLVASGSEKDHSFSVMKAEAAAAQPKADLRQGPAVQSGSYPAADPSSAVRNSTKAKRSVAVPVFAWEGDLEGEAVKITLLVISGLVSSGKVDVLPWSSVPEKTKKDHFEGVPLSLSKWKSSGADEVLIGRVLPSPAGILVEYRLISTETAGNRLAGRARGPRELARIAAERIASDVVSGTRTGQESRLVPSVVAVPVLVADGVDSRLAERLSDAVSEEFSSSGYVRALPFDRHPHRIEPMHFAGSAVDYALWAQRGADWVVVGKVSPSKSQEGSFSISADCVDTVSGKAVARLRSESTEESFRQTVRSFVDSQMETMASLARARTERASSKKTGIAADMAADGDGHGMASGGFGEEGLAEEPPRRAKTFQGVPKE